MSRGDGKNPKFRILCKRCNSYQHTRVTALCIVCDRCGNTAERFDEEMGTDANEEEA
jgi:hypothetical protein